jgi:hypothetical protein
MSVFSLRTSKTKRMRCQDVIKIDIENNKMSAAIRCEDRDI